MTDQPPSPELPARERLMTAGARLFSEKGFDGASVREICDRAEVSSRMIHHYFGSKRGLFDAIADAFTEKILDVPIRIIAAPVDSAQALAERFEIFITETLHALMEQRAVFEILVRERITPTAFAVYYGELARFFAKAQAAGLVRSDLDTSLLTGMVLDRVGSQVFFADAQLELTGRNVFTDPDYRRDWIKANTSLMLNGLLTG